VDDYRQSEILMASLIAENSALIVIDMQKGFLRDESGMGRIGFDLTAFREVIQPCVKLVETARKAGIPIIYTRYVFSPDYSDGGIMVELLPALKTEKALQAGDWEVELTPELLPGPGEYVIDKNKPSAFWGTNLDDMLQKWGVTRLIVCGITTNCCVESTVRDSSHRDIETWVVADAVAESSPDRHEYALKGMGMLFAHMTSVAEVEAALAP
jgi:ureidoacrylate peracid hydrolase